MADKEAPGRFEIVCPLCRGALTVDRKSGVVLHAAPAKGGGQNFEAALDEIRTAQSQREQQFSKAFQSERQRRASLDKKFEVAKEKAATDPDGEPPNPMDAD
jgi:hypothetical protein